MTPRTLTVPMVLGDVPMSSLGSILPHEHLFSDSTASSPPVRRDAIWAHYDEVLALSNYYEIRRDHINFSDQRLDSIADAVVAVEEFKAHGGGTIVDANSIGLCRRPESSEPWPR